MSVIHFSARDLATIAAASGPIVDCTTRALEVASLLESSSRANVETIENCRGCEPEETVVSAREILDALTDEENDFDRTTPTLLAGLAKLSALIVNSALSSSMAVRLANLSITIGTELGRRAS